ncbi:MAG: T9SS type A sorting domain-containing protein [Calditrichaceae bacterium]
MALAWQGSEYELVPLPPGVIVSDPYNLPPGAITEDNYDDPDNAGYEIEFFDGYDDHYPFKYFRINNPGLGGWTYAIIENEPPPADETEPLRVYMANESDLVLDFKSDRERYTLSKDQYGQPEPVFVNLEARLLQGGETSGLEDHTKTVGEPVNDAIIGVQVTAPDSQISVAFMQLVGDGIYTLGLETTLLGNYDIKVIASDNVPNESYNNSQYIITTEHSFYISPFAEPTELTGQLYIQYAKDILEDIMMEYCPSKQECSLDKNTSKDLDNAISLITTALNYFESDGNHLKIRKGLSFYDNMTAAVNDIYSYLSVAEFGDDIDQAIHYLKEGSYKLAVIARDEAEAYDCQDSNCEELLKNTNSELGKAWLDSKQSNYVYVFNHLTNAWKFAMNIMGANLKKQAFDNYSEETNLPKKFKLEQNYPNPFNPSTRINYQLPEKKHVSLKIYDIQGNLVASLVDKDMDAGYHTIEWNASGYASGVYFYRIKTGSYVATKRLLLLK